MVGVETALRDANGIAGSTKRAILPVAGLVGNDMIR